MAHLWANPNPSPRIIPAHHKLELQLGDRTRETNTLVSSSKDGVLQPPTPGPSSGPRLGRSTSGNVGEGETAKDRGYASSSSSTKSSSSSSTSRKLKPDSPRTAKRNRERRPRSASNSDGSRTERDTTTTSMRPRPRSRSRPVLEPIAIENHSHTQNQGGIDMVIDRGIDAAQQHDGDYVDSPASTSTFFGSRPPSRATSRSEESREEGSGESLNPAQVDALSLPTLTAAVKADGHARNISAESGMTGRQELVRRALADGPGHGHGHPQGHPHAHLYNHAPGTVPFPSSTSTASTSSGRPRTNSRRTPMDLSVDIDLASRPSRPGRHRSASRSPSSSSRSRPGSAPHSPVLPNGSVGIGPALGIAKAGARLRAIVDDAERDVETGGSSSTLLPSRPRTNSAKSVPRRRISGLGGSGSSTPTALMTRSTGLDESHPGALAARRRAKSLVSPTSPRGDDRDISRGSSSRRVELGTRRRSSASRVRTNSDLKRPEREHDSADKLGYGRKRGATVHFPPTPMDETEGVPRLSEATVFPSRSVPSKLDQGDSVTPMTRSISETNGLRQETAGSETDRQGKRRRVRSRWGDESTDGETSRGGDRPKKGKERARDRDRYRNGFEEVFETERSSHGHGDGDPLQTLLASVDINNALRLISQTTLMPGGRQAVLPGTRSGLAMAGSLTTAAMPKILNGVGAGSSRDRPPEIFVAKAPPSVTASPAYVDSANGPTHDTESVKAKAKLVDRAGQKKSKLSAKIEESPVGHSLDSLGKKALKESKVKIKSRRGTMIERDSVRPQLDESFKTAVGNTDEHDPALSSDEEDLDRVSSSIGHGGSAREDRPFRDDHSYRSEPYSNGSVNQAFRPITPDPHSDHGNEKPAAATPESSKKKRLSGLFHLRHSRSTSGSKWRMDSKVKEKADPAKSSAAREAAERDAAEHEAKVQAVLLSLPSHPRCEALAYQARSHFQAYYGLMVRSLEDAEQKAGQPCLKWNPLRVIRWRKQVLAEEKRRQNWDANVNEQIKAHARVASTAEEGSLPRDGWEDQIPDSVGRSGSKLQQLNKVVSPPLRSAAALSRALASDPQAAMSLRKSGAFKEWIVLPSEILAFLDCRGNVDYFVPATDTAQDGLRMAMANAPMPHADGVPISRGRAAVYPHQNGMSPSSYESSQGNKSSVSFTSDTPEFEQNEAHQNFQKRKSVTRRMWANSHLSRHHSNTSRESDHGDSFAHVLKSPIDAIRRHVLHRESDVESDGEQESRAHDRLIQYRHGRLHKLAHPNQHRDGRTSMDGVATQLKEQENDLAVVSRRSSVAPVALSLHGQTDGADDQTAPEKKPGWTHIEGATDQDHAAARTGMQGVDPEREEEYTKHETLIRNADNLLAKLMIDLAPVSINFGQTLHVFQEGIEHVNRASGTHLEIPDMQERVIARGKAEISHVVQQINRPGSQPGSRSLSRRGSLQTPSNLLPGLRELQSRKTVDTKDGRTVDPMTALEQILDTLSKQYDEALPKAITLAQQQDDLQDQVSLLTTRAEQLRVKLDVEGNGKIRRQRAQLQSMRLPNERSVDNWFYMLIRYLFNGALALGRVYVHIQRFFLGIIYYIRQVVTAPYRAVRTVIAFVMTAGRFVLGNWVIRTILLLAAWTIIVLNFFVDR